MAKMVFFFSLPLFFLNFHEKWEQNKDPGRGVKFLVKQLFFFFLLFAHTRKERKKEKRGKVVCMCRLYPCENYKEK